MSLTLRTAALVFSRSFIRRSIAPRPHIFCQTKSLIVSQWGHRFAMTRFRAPISSLFNASNSFSSDRPPRDIRARSKVKATKEDEIVRKEKASEEEDRELTLDEELAQLNLTGRLNLLFKKYWYVLVPLHAALSTVWFGSCFLLVKSGVEIDVVGLLETLHLPETIIKPLRNPNLGAVALALIYYKLASPLRYVSTLTVAVPAIKELVRRGLIKPVMSQAKIKAMIKERMPSRRPRRK